ncbi:MAG TPA: flagellar hook-basal body complex protein [Verrucomicrobiae bacterium]|nr:flagellar hook-basal body complex protein [Verrucomicrobiae bacterium]
MAGFDSLYTGITGLNAYQSWIDMISNNIANVDTTGFKGQSMTFADLFYQNQTFASAPTTTNGGVNGQQLGYGVKVNSVDTDWTQGGLDTTGVNTNLAINGDGFFILNNLTGSQSPVYTRDGDFSINSNGVLYDPASGLAVQGWTAKDGVVTPGGATGNITIPLGLQMQATATGAGTKVGPTGDSVFDVALGGNLDQTQWQQSFLDTIGASATNGTAYTVTTTMYDSLGNAHEATITYTPDTTGATAATLTAGGAGQTITAGACIASGSISQSDNLSTTVTVTANTNNTYTLTDTLGNSVTEPAGATNVQFDGATLNLVTPAVAGDKQAFTIAAATNGLPSGVENAAGQEVTPATRWAVSVSFSDGTQFQTLTQPGEVEANGTTTTSPTFGTGSSGLVGYVYFDQNGQFINTSTIQGDTTDPAGTAYVINQNSVTAAGADTFHTADSTPATAQGNLLDVTQWGPSAGDASQQAQPGAIALGFWQDASLAGSYTATTISQNGYAAGTLDNITVGDDGTITGAFTNGENETLGQVAIARFSNEDGLERLGNNQFGASANSGLAQVGVAGTGVYGSVQSGALEESNVSLSTEFVNLIAAQRAFEANTRGITTADQNLQTIINLRASEN